MAKFHKVVIKFTGLMDRTTSKMVIFYEQRAILFNLESGRRWCDVRTDRRTYRHTDAWTDMGNT